MSASRFHSNLFYQLRVAQPAGAGGTNVSLGLCQILELRALSKQRLSLSFSVSREDAWRGFVFVKRYCRRADDPTGSIYVSDRSGDGTGLVSLLDLGCKVMVESVSSRNAVKVVGHDNDSGGPRLMETNVCRFFSSTPFHPASPAISKTVAGRPPSKWSSQDLETELLARGLPSITHKEAALAILKSMVISDLLESTQPGYGSAETIPSIQGTMAMAHNELDLEMMCIGEMCNYLSDRPSTLEDLRPRPPATSQPEGQPDAASHKYRATQERQPSLFARNSESGSSSHSSFISQASSRLMGNKSGKPPAHPTKRTSKMPWLAFRRSISESGPAPDIRGSDAPASSQPGQLTEAENKAIEREDLEASKKQMWLLRSSSPVVPVSSMKCNHSTSSCPATGPLRRSTSFLRASAVEPEDGELRCERHSTGGRMVNPFRQRSTSTAGSVVDCGSEDGGVVERLSRGSSADRSSAGSFADGSSGGNLAKNFLKTSLPERMLPASITAVAGLPDGILRRSTDADGFSERLSSGGRAVLYSTRDTKYGHSDGPNSAGPFPGRSSHSCPAASNRTSLDGEATAIVGLDSGSVGAHQLNCGYAVNIQDLLGAKVAPRYLRNGPSYPSFNHRR